MIGLDTSFLVALTIREHPAHDACWKLFESDIRGHEGSAAITPQVLTEFAHVVTDPNRFDRPLAMPEALEICNQWWHARECRAVATTPHTVRVFIDWMNHHQLGRKRLLDTLLAASYHCAGVTRLATTNWRDFRIFDVFDIITLR